MYIVGKLTYSLAFKPQMGEDADLKELLMYGHKFGTPLFSFPLAIWAFGAYYGGINFFWRFMMKFWSFWGLWGVLFGYFWTSFTEDLF